MRYSNPNDPIKLEFNFNLPIDCEISISEEQLDMMVAQGVDVTDEWNVLDFFRDHQGETIDGVHLPAYSEFIEDWHTRHDDQIEVVDSNAWGEAPERFFSPDDGDD